MDAGFYSTLTDLARLGSAGVGLAVFLMVFILLLRGKPLDEAAARLREKFLIYGVLFAVFSGVTAVVTPLVAPEPRAATNPVRLRLAFSPDFGTESLTPPKIRLPDGSEGKPDEQFTIPPADVTQVLTIGVDSALKEVKDLRAASAALAQSVATVQEQRDRLARAAPTPVRAPRARAGLERGSNESEALRAEVAQSVRSGDFNRAATLSRELQVSVGRSDVAVNELAQSE